MAILRRAAVLIIMFGLISVAGSAWAGTEDKLRNIESELGRKQQQQATLDQEAKKTGANLNNLRQQLIDVTESLQTKAEEQERLEDKLDEMTREAEAKNQALKDARQKFRLFTQALIEFSRSPPESLLLQTGLTMDHIHRSILLRSALPYLRQQEGVITHDLAALGELQQRIEEQQNAVAATQQNLQGQQRELDQLIKARQGLLRRTETEKEAIARRLVSLSNEARDLRQLLEKITPPHTSRSIAPHGTQAVLKPPVSGALVRGFGAKDADGVVSQGLTYAALPGSPVVAPRSGRVVFTGPFRGYGKILILQHDGGYHSFLAGFGRIDAEMGQDVDAGEPLGVLPVKTAARPELYFEWRRSNEPVDPSGNIAFLKN